ncbi:MAG TPA: hypothetical protein VKP68_03990, partial [Ramlibacter sp.]|nr:hypothetical protein [Ramlibacter sp.]
LRTLLGVVGIVLVSVPLSAVVTLLLFPFWSWLEASTGIESVGHSGPADWCYLSVFVLLAAGGLTLFLAGRGSGRQDWS